MAWGLSTGERLRGEGLGLEESESCRKLDWSEVTEGSKSLGASESGVDGSVSMSTSGSMLISGGATVSGVDGDSRRVSELLVCELAVGTNFSRRV